MNKRNSIFLLFFLLSNVALSQVKDLGFKVRRSECSLVLKFKNRGDSGIVIPNFSLRSKVEKQYSVLSKEFLRLAYDTLIISLERRNSQIEKMIVISDSFQKPNVKIYYCDYCVKYNNVQRVRLPYFFCGIKFRFIKILIDGKLLQVATVKNY